MTSEELAKLRKEVFPNLEFANHIPRRAATDTSTTTMEDGHMEVDGRVCDDDGVIGSDEIYGQ